MHIFKPNERPILKDKDVLGVFEELEDGRVIFISKEDDKRRNLIDLESLPVLETLPEQHIGSFIMDRRLSEIVKKALDDLEWRLFVAEELEEYSDEL